MNFEGIPDWNYWAVTAAILGFVVVGVTVAIRRKWL
jgi:Mg2+ and Co2+ transporter CorA